LRFKSPKATRPLQNYLLSGMANFQVKLAGDFKDYSNDEDKILKRAYMAGFPNARFKHRGQNYMYDFRKMVQLNTDSGKSRSLRQPRKWRPPAKPLVPAGPTTVVNVPRGSAGTTIQVPHPRIKGAFISVNVPASAKAGQAMLVPVPPADAVAAATGSPAPSAKGSSWTTGGIVAAGTVAVAGVAGVAVGGAILGSHIAEHGLDATVDAAGEGIADAAEATADFAVDAAEATADFAVEAGEFIVDAAEDMGDFVMDLF